MKTDLENSKINLPNIFIFTVLVAIIARLCFWVITIFYPISNETGLLISPIYPNSGIDLNFYYEESLNYKIFFKNLFNLIFSASDNHLNHLYNKSATISPGPIFPIILIITNFFNYPWVLSFIYFLVSSYLVYISLKWLKKNNVNIFWLFLYGLLPVPFWYMLNISPDLLFSTIITIFIFSFFSNEKKTNKKIAYLIILAILATLLKPNGISLFIFIFVFIFFTSNLNIKIKTSIIIFSISIFLVFIYLNANYLLTYITASNSNRTIFGYYQIDYYSGIYNFLPDFLNKIFSLISLFIAKLLYFSGLRPTYGDTLNLFIVIRSSAGLIIFPGLIWLFFKGSFNEKLFIVLFIFPILLGLAQERYSLPIYPLLFYYGTLFYSYIFKYIYNALKST